METVIKQTNVVWCGHYGNINPFYIIRKKVRLKRALE